MFNRESFVIIDSQDIPDLVNPELVRFWDFAATEPSSTNRDPDYTVGVLMMKDQGQFYVVDVKRVRKESHEVEKLVAETAEEDGPHVAIRMEQEPGSSGKAIGDHYARTVVPGYDFEYDRATGDKVLRAKPLKSVVNNGNLKLIRGPWITDFLDEFSAFPEAADHDDQVDATSGAFGELTGLGKKFKNKIKLVV
jgi:predicted phage terminase large subunit-like protein